MAIFRGTIRSKTLMMDTSVNIVVPYEQHYAATKAREFKTVILLHGLKQNADAWPRMSRVEPVSYTHLMCIRDRRRIVCCAPQEE